MDRTTQRVLSRMSFNKFCPTATKYVTIGQIKFYDGPDAGLGADLGAGPGAGPKKNFEILKFDDLTDFKVFSVINGIDIKYD